MENTWEHSHVFDEGNPLAERNTLWAVVLTATMMVAEIAGGWLFNSMALLADGWHMSSHALALGLSAMAYAFARRLAHDSRFAFGTWKIEVLGGYTSALFLVGVAGLMLYQSGERLLHPTSIHYNQAIFVASIGLGVNLVCAWLLHGGHDHGHHGHGHHHHDHHSHSHHGHRHDNQGHNPGPRHAHKPSNGHHHHDLNLRSAYLHVVADAATSVLAIFALIGGKLLGASWLDPVMGIVGAGLVAVWAYGLLRDTSRVLLDAEMNAPVVAEVREAVNSAAVTAQISDLHVWRVGKAKYACILSVVTDADASPDVFKQALAVHEELAHVTVELNRHQPAGGFAAVVAATAPASANKDFNKLAGGFAHEIRNAITAAQFGLSAVIDKDGDEPSVSETNAASVVELVRVVKAHGDKLPPPDLDAAQQACETLHENNAMIEATFDLARKSTSHALAVTEQFLDTLRPDRKRS